MALDPYRRKTKQRYHRPADADLERWRVPMIVAAVGFVVMLALIYNLSAAVVRSATAQMFAARVQAPP